MRFEDLGIGKPILRAIREMGYDAPTPIQQKPAAMISRKPLVMIFRSPYAIPEYMALSNNLS